MTILVTGANGQVGWELVRQAHKYKLPVRGFGSKELNVTDAKQVENVVSAIQPTMIINAAAYTAVDRAESEPELAYAVNRDGVANLAIACRKQGIPLLHISTDYIFDGSKEGAYTEEDAPNPRGVYGASKLAGEVVLAETLQQYLILRVSWVFGSHGNNFVKTMLRLAADRTEIRVVDDQFGAPTPARAIAETLLRIASDVNKKSTDFPCGVFHLESNPGVSWYDFANRIFFKAERAGALKSIPKVVPIPSAAYPTPVERPKNSKLKTTRKLTCGDSLLIDWESDLDLVIEELSK